MNLKKYQLWLLPVISGLLLSCGWMANIFQLLVFFGFIPMLIVEDYYFRQHEKYRSIRIFPKALLGFLVWNAATSFWIWNASESGAIMAIVFNSIFMATLFWIFHATKRKLGQIIGYITFIIYWIGFEYLHLNWELSWTWLTLGNGLSENLSLIQWYEYTGVLGGSLWILLINVLLTIIILKHFTEKDKKKIHKQISIVALVIVIPVIISITIFFTYKEKINPVEVVVVQPNIDPYNEKFGNMPVEQQLEKIMKLSDSLTSSQTDYIVAPETAIPQGIWEEDLNTHPYALLLKQLILRHPHTNLVIGASTFKMYGPGEKHSPTAKKFNDTDEYYESYNTALQFDSTNNVQIYHKSKLVLGVERMPFASLGFLQDLSLELGGTASSLGTQDEPSVFSSNHGLFRVAPAICYESIYGEYITEYVKKGANFIFVITNDGWWGNTPGYRQHLSYSSLRAIETRRDIARSANTGISCFINQLGKIQQPTKWWTPAVIKQKINTNDKITFYVSMGDYIGRITATMSVLIFLFFIILHFRKKRD
jgi:apolipoprotein N-acyltransferase